VKLQLEAPPADRKKGWQNRTHKDKYVSLKKKNGKGNCDEQNSIENEK
jgi:hypothetical protein